MDGNGKLLMSKVDVDGVFSKSDGGTPLASSELKGVKHVGGGALRAVFLGSCGFREVFMLFL